MTGQDHCSRRQFFGRAAAAPFGIGASGGDRPTKGWIILAADWKYNDEFSYATDGFHPLPRVFLTHVEAETDCRRLCDEFFSEQTPQDFEADFAFYDCDPDTATWDELREAGFPDPYTIEEVEL
jgi:hypothetical protein